MLIQLANEDSQIAGVSSLTAELNEDAHGERVRLAMTYEGRELAFCPTEKASAVIKNKLIAFVAGQIMECDVFDECAECLADHFDILLIWQTEGE